MASFAAQLKDMFLGLVDRVTGAGRDKDVPEATKLPASEVQQLQPVEIRSKDPTVPLGSVGAPNSILPK